MGKIGSMLWGMIEAIAHFFVFGFLGLFHKELTDEQWENFVQFMKFALVGLSNTVVTYVVYAILVTLTGIHYQLANAIGWIVGVFNSYYWNNKLVFVLEEGQKRNHIKALAKCFVSYGASFVLSAVLLFIWVDLLHIPELLGPIINLVVTTPLNFIMNKLWAFKDSNKQEQQQ